MENPRLRIVRPRRLQEMRESMDVRRPARTPRFRLVRIQILRAVVMRGKEINLVGTEITYEASNRFGIVEVAGRRVVNSVLARTRYPAEHETLRRQLLPQDLAILARVADYQGSRHQSPTISISGSGKISLPPDAR